MGFFPERQWAALWSSVKDDTTRELFWQLLRTREVSHVVPGKAPMNNANAIAEQAPDTNKYLEHLCLVALDDLQPRGTLAVTTTASCCLVPSGSPMLSDSEGPPS
ncbi:hypothetical protein WJX77_003878 [Trebouxia sp. C0004]